MRGGRTISVGNIFSEIGDAYFTVKARDRYRGRPLDLAEKWAIATVQNTSDLRETINIAIAIKIMITCDTNIDLDVTNGARGKIIEIVLREDEPECFEACLEGWVAVIVFVCFEISAARFLRSRHA